MERFDLKKIEEIVGSASNPRDAFEKLHAVFPELEVEKMQEHMDFIQSQVETAAKGEDTKVPVELNAEELKMVVGSSWWGDNWKRLAATAVVSAGAAVFCGAMGALAGGGVGVN